MPSKKIVVTGTESIWRVQERAARQRALLLLVAPRLAARRAIPLAAGRVDHVADAARANPSAPASDAG